MVFPVYAVWLCGASGTRSRGYNGSAENLRVADENYLRLAFADAWACDSSRDRRLPPVQPVHECSLRELLLQPGLGWCGRVVGLAFLKLSNIVYQSRLDALTAEQRVVLLVGIFTMQSTRQVVQYRSQLW